MKLRRSHCIGRESAHSQRSVSAANQHDAGEQSGTTRTARMPGAARRRGTARRRAPRPGTPTRTRWRFRRPRAASRLCRRLQQIVRERRGHRRHRQEERELRRRRPIEAEQHRADDRRARTGHTRDRAPSTWHSADAERARQRRAIRVDDGRLRPVALATSMTMPPTMNATAMTGRRRIQHPLDEAGEKRARDHRRA